MAHTRLSRPAWAYPDPGFGSSVLSRGLLLQRHWRELLRYHKNLAYRHEVDRDRIAIAVGLTVPEAYDSGLLPFQVIPPVRPDDPVTPEDCRNAMIDEGASVLLGASNPQLRFAALEEAEACRQRLTRRLPGSEKTWSIAQDIARIID